MLRTIIIAAAGVLIFLVLFGLGAAAFGYPGIAGATAGIAQLVMYGFLIVGVATVLIALLARRVKD